MINIADPMSIFDILDILMGMSHGMKRGRAALRLKEECSWKLST
jgi:hypothetical protein